MQSWHIHISGRVQGVGFRPFVYRLAQSFHLKGTVQNGLDGVHIYVNAEADTLDAFCRLLQTKAPDIAQISELRCEEVGDQPFSDFRIISSDNTGPTKLLITPDLAMCENCRQELHDAGNRRYHYPFITCTHCGPRYSILQSLPFDRENTSMENFQMCSECTSEYSDINHTPGSGPSQPENITPRSVPSQTENTTPRFVPSQTGISSFKETQSGTRYHAQTNSCQDCGIQLSLHDLTNDTPRSVPPQTGSGLGENKSSSPPFAKGKTIPRSVPPLSENIAPRSVPPQTGSKTDNSEKIINEVANLLLSGKIIAVKGIGGYMLMADATSVETVEALRRRKQRPAKPFALMYPDLTTAKLDVEISPKEAEELLSYRAPILLLRMKKHQHSGIALQQVAPGLDKLGVMLPYTPLFELMAKAVNRPLIATSANLSGSPIFYRDEEALENLQGIADYVLANDREIRLPQDDSVMQFSQKHQQPIILRRSRGLAPAYRLPENSPLAEHSCLAMGAQQKSSFALTAHQQLYLSQYLGELSNYHTTEAYRKTLDYFLQLCQAEPEVIIADLHPEYFATQLGQQLSKEKNIPIRYVQHHQAHFASVLAENELLETSDPVLGVIWDGTGLGEDRQIWGGEFFTYADQQMERIAHLKYFPQRFGDKMAREPRLSLLCLAGENPDFEEMLQQKFNPQEWKLYQKILGKPAAVQTSSMGRLFDAVASLLGLCDVSQYESQAAILLEQHAAAYLEKHWLLPEDGYTFQTKDKTFEAPLPAMLHDLQDGMNSGEVAARFHLGLVRLVREVARTQQIRKIALSGGVFQNALLNDLLITYLQDEFSLYFHQQLSPNDESLPLGQIACHWLSQQKTSKKTAAITLEPETLNL